MYYVSMEDTFLSGWGKAKGKTNVLIFSCKDMNEALIVAENAGNRADMVAIKIWDREKPVFSTKEYYPQDKDIKEYPRWYEKGFFKKKARAGKGTCADIVMSQWKSREEDFRKMFKGDRLLMLGYGLSINMVEKGTFGKNQKAYIRYELSTGGPADEIRLYRDGKLVYWYLDWFDGASLDISDNDLADDLREYMRQHFEDF